VGEGCPETETDAGLVTVWYTAWGMVWWALAATCWMNPWFGVVSAWYAIALEAATAALGIAGW
jgi:hypothetical protein